MRERWKSVVGFEGLYEVSDRGQVRSVDRKITTSHGHVRNMPGRVLKPRPLGRAGHLRVQLGREHDRLVHRLVLEAFVGPCPEEMECLHFNDVADDNRLSNLRWGTPHENHLDMVRNGNHFYAKRTHCSKGHEYTEENTRITSKNSRACRTCERAYFSERYQRSKIA